MDRDCSISTIAVLLKVAPIYHLDHEDDVKQDGWKGTNGTSRMLEDESTQADVLTSVHEQGLKLLQSCRKLGPSI